MLLCGTEDNGFGHFAQAVVLEVVDDLSYTFNAVRQNNRAIEILERIELLWDLFAIVIHLIRLWQPPSLIFIEIDTDHAIWRKISFFNALFEGVGEDRSAKIGGVVCTVRGVRGGRKAQLDSRVEIFQDLTPRAFF